MTEAQALAYLKRAAEAETMRGLAQRLGVSAGHLCHVLKGRKDPAPMLARFGFQKINRYRRITHTHPKKAIRAALAAREMEVG